jgi:hypothetical protein
MNGAIFVPRTGFLKSSQNSGRKSTLIVLETIKSPRLFDEARKLQRSCLYSSVILGSLKELLARAFA